MLFIKYLSCSLYFKNKTTKSFQFELFPNLLNTKLKIKIKFLVFLSFSLLKKNIFNLQIVMQIQSN